MAALIDGLTELAQKEFGKKDPRRALRKLYVVDEESPGAIGRRYGCTPTAVRYLLEKWKIKRKRAPATGIKKNLKSLGFRTLEAYFKANWNKTKEEMGDDLGVSAVTVAKHYDAWVAGVEDKGGKKGCRTKRKQR
jgi:hypothetical protein